MRILSITAQKPHSTGSGTYLTELVRAFDRKGAKQAVVAGIYRDDDVSLPLGVDFYPVVFSCGDSEGDISFPIAGMSDVMPYVSTRYRDLTDEMIAEFEKAFLTQIEKAVEDLDPDIILCHHLFLLTAAVRNHFPDRKIYGICHGTDLRQMVNCDRIAAGIRAEIRKLDHVFALHGEQAESIKSIFGMDEDAITVIGSGFNDHLFNTEGRIRHSRSEPVRVCYAGKMSCPKGVPELLAALTDLNFGDGVAPFEVRLAGGCKDESVRCLLADLPGNIQYLDQIPQSQLADLFKTSDIFVLPSYFEGLNLAVIEAMASGLLPICTDLPGMKEWVDASVKDPNIRYIPMPEMSAIDTPTDAGRTRFTEDLKSILRNAINDVYNDTTQPVPDCSGITWDSVAANILQDM